MQSLLIMARTKDPSYDNAPINAFSIVEINVAIISACLPTLRPLLATWFKGLGGTGTTTTNTAGSQGRKGSSVMSPYSIDLKSLSAKRGVERLDGESDEHIHVVTRVDVKVQEKDGQGTSQKSSTESLVRDISHMV